MVNKVYNKPIFIQAFFDSCLSFRNHSTNVICIHGNSKDLVSLGVSVRNHHRRSLWKSCNVFSNFLAPKVILLL